MNQDVNTYLLSDRLYDLVNDAWGSTNGKYAKPTTCIQTHCAKIYLAGEIALKVKLPVKYSYIDLSDLSKRYRCLKNEYAINSSTLPEIYLGLAGILPTKNGSLTLLSEGDIEDKSSVTEWCLLMRRFDERDVLDNIAISDGISDSLAKNLGEEIARYHRNAERVVATDGAERILEIIEELELEYERLEPLLPVLESRLFIRSGRREFKRVVDQLKQRGENGFVRKCHGDLHLKNIVMHNGKPVPFDALEFDERLRTIDTLYDLAFLLMDLDHRFSLKQENLLLNQYLIESESANIAAMKLVPLFMFCRSGIRAMAILQSSGAADKQVKLKEARYYLQHGLRYLAHRKPVVICIGGFSGSGKSTIASTLVNEICQSPGAVLIRSDSERKHMFGVKENEDLGADHYTTTNSNKVYEQLHHKVKLVCEAGYPAIVDATFLTEKNRQEIQNLVEEHKVEFHGFWLMAPVSVMMERIANRGEDASDASASVLKKQMELTKGRIDWTPIDTSETVPTVSRKIVSRIKEKTSDKLSVYG